MKNKKFFYQQYERVNWENQEKTKLNYFVYDYIIKNIILKKKKDSLKIFDMGFGVGAFLKKSEKNLSEYYSNITLEGCEPSYKNYKNFKSKPFNQKKVKLRTFNKTFLQTNTDTKFDFLTAIYVFPHLASDELDDVAKKINSMLNNEGKFILVVANEEYLENKLKEKKDLFIEKNTIKFNGKKYNEYLHYSEIPEIGTIIDYNREENLYVDLFKKHSLNLDLKENLNDNGFVSTLFVFSKNKE